MKYFVCVLLLAVATAAPIEEKKQEKRGVLGLGYGGLGYGGLGYGHGLGYGYGLGHGYGLSHGLGYGLGHGLGYGYGLGHGVGYGYGLGHGLYGGIAHAPIASPVIAKTVAAPLHYGGYGSPWLGLGHGYIH